MAKLTARSPPAAQAGRKKSRGWFTLPPTLLLHLRPGGQRNGYVTSKDDRAANGYRCTAASYLQRRRSGNSPLHHQDRQGEIGRRGGRPRATALHRGSVGYVRRRVDVRCGAHRQRVCRHGRMCVVDQLMALRSLLTDGPEVAEQLLRVLARRLRRSDDTLTGLFSTDGPGRVAMKFFLSSRSNSAHLRCAARHST